MIALLLSGYALFEISDEWRNYLRLLIETYDDSHVIPALSASTAGGALLSEKDREGGAAAGLGVGLVGLLLHSASKPSYGSAVKVPDVFVKLQNSQLWKFQMRRL